MTNKEVAKNLNGEVKTVVPALADRVAGLESGMAQILAALKDAPVAAQAKATTKRTARGDGAIPMTFAKTTVRYHVFKATDKAELEGGLYFDLDDARIAQNGKPAKGFDMVVTNVRR